MRLIRTRRMQDHSSSGEDHLAHQKWPLDIGVQERHIFDKDAMVRSMLSSSCAHGLPPADSCMRSGLQHSRFVAEASVVATCKLRMRAEWLRGISPAVTGGFLQPGAVTS